MLALRSAGSWTLLSVACLVAGLISAQQQQQKQQQQDFGPCYRECVTGDTRVCKFNFTEEIYNAMNAACGECAGGVAADCDSPQCISLDGVERTVYSINRMLPGPSIHVCAGDTVLVDLHVRLTGHGDTIHWHGLRQRDTPYMDGVSMITQCPVMAGQSFRYRFVVDEPGTYFYHTHNGVHKVNGGVGVLVGRAPRDADPSSNLFDKDLAEHSVFLMDWMHVDAEYVYPGLQQPLGQQATSILINGRGNFKKSDGNWTQTPLAEFHMQRGLRYRLRVVNSGGLSCPIVLRVLGHKMTIIASDSEDVEPLVVDSLYTFSGERYDVVVTADQDGDAFWMHSYTAGACATSSVDQVAVLRYTDADGKAPVGLPSDPRPSATEKNRAQLEGVVMNAPSCGDDSSHLCATHLQSLADPTDAKLQGLLGDVEPEHSVTLGVSFHTFTNQELYSPSFPNFITFGTSIAGTVNNVSFVTPAAPLLTQPGDTPTCGGCPDGQGFCSCTQVIKVPLGSRFELVLVDKTDVDSDGVAGMLSHPMHIHGYTPYVLGTGSLANIKAGLERLQFVRDNVQELRAPQGKALARPPAKDVVMLPRAGYIVMRFLADNPGMWFFHCHFQYHMASGMEAAVQVGEYTDFVKPPPNFPTCGNYMPDE